MNKGDFMFMKKGNLVSSEDAEKPLLESPEGKRYEVTHVVAYVWENLDGKTSLDSINNKIKEISSPDESIDFSQFSHTIADELLKVDLITPVQV